MTKLIFQSILLAVACASIPVFADEQKSPDASEPSQTAGQRAGNLLTNTANMGNIAPYRHDMLMRIAKNWKPSKDCSLTAQVKVSKEGKLLSAQIEKSSGDKIVDKQVLESLHATKFAPLPEWYHSDSLEFKVDLGKS